MTQYAPDHTSLTNRLTTFVTQGRSWLDHRGCCGQVDWALLYGATASELCDIRITWRNHVAHLRTVHFVTVTEEPPDFFRIVGATQPPTIVGDGAEVQVEAACDDEDDGDESATPFDSLGGLQPMPQAPNVRILHTARVLVALHGAGELTNPLHKDSVGMLIRQASECNHWHNSAHYRSAAAATKIADANITTVWQYQKFCRRYLRHEHMVPNTVIYRMIIQNSAPTVEWLMDLFSRYSKRATITRDEDKILRAFEMPNGFYEPGHEWHQDPLSRYREAGLFEQLTPLAPDAKWFVRP